MTKNVAIDNDFLSHLVNITGVENLYALIIDFFKEMNVSPEMHPLVYDNEARAYQKELAAQLFTDGIVNINKSDFNQIKNDSSKKRVYEIQIKQVYKDFMGTIYPCKNICEEWMSRKSLGEVHTVVFCATIGYDCFLSDDKDAAQKLGKIIKNRMIKSVEVKNRQDCCNYIKTLPNRTCNLKSKDLGIIAHKHTK